MRQLVLSIGHSTKAIFYFDDEKAHRAFEAIAEGMDNYRRSMRDSTIAASDYGGPGTVRFSTDDGIFCVSLAALFDVSICDPEQSEDTDKKTQIYFGHRQKRIDEAVKDADAHTSGY